MDIFLWDIKKVTLGRAANLQKQNPSSYRVGDLNSNLCLPTMPYSVITIVTMLTCQSACGCVCQSAWEFLAICFFIVSYSNIILNMQTFRYFVGYLLVKFTKELLEN